MGYVSRSTVFDFFSLQLTYGGPFTRRTRPFTEVKAIQVLRLVPLKKGPSVEEAATLTTENTRDYFELNLVLDEPSNPTIGFIYF